MERKLNLFQNERLDLPDAQAIHDLVDAELRRHGSAVFADAALTGIAGITPTAMILSGWTCRVNPGDNTQVLVTPGDAVCSEEVEGSEVFGQISVADATEVVVDFSGTPASTRYIHARFAYTDGDYSQRARWRPDLATPREELIAHYTRRVSSVQVTHTATDVPVAGWFLVAEVAWDGSLVAADVKDRRCLFFEGQAAGTANPATTWTLPTITQSTSRGVNGVRSLFTWAQAVNARLAAIIGRDSWWRDPISGENLRGGSRTTYGRSSAYGPNFALTAPTTADLEQVFNGTTTDPKGAAAFLPGLFWTVEDYSLDVSGGPVGLNATAHRIVEGPARILRSAGANQLFETSGWKGEITGITFEAASGATDELFRGADATDEITFTNCRFVSLVATKSAFVAAAAGRYTFVNCEFAGAGAGSAINVISAAVVSLSGCKFDGYAKAIDVSSGHTLVAACHFANCAKGVVGTSVDVVTVIGPTFDTVTSHVELDTFTQAAGADGGVFATGPVAGSDLRTTSPAVYMGATDTEFLGMTGGLFDVRSDVFSIGGRGDVAGRNLHAEGGKVQFSSVLTATQGVRFEHISADSRVALLDGASTDDASSTIAQVHQLQVGSWASIYGRLTAALVPLAWGIIYKQDNTTTHTGRLVTKNGSLSLAAVATLTFLGTDNYHKWTVPVLPAGYTIPGNRISITAAIHTDHNVAADGRLDERGVVAVEHDASNIYFYPVLINAGGTQIGWATTNPGVDNNFTAGTSYKIEWVVFGELGTL